MAGIEKIKSALDDLFKLGYVFADAYGDDRQISFFEWLNILKNVWGAKGIISDAGELYDEYCDLDDGEREQLQEYFKDKFDIGSDEALEELIEGAWCVAIEIDSWVRELIEYRKQ